MVLRRYRFVDECKSIALGDEVFGELFNSFVEFPRVLGDTILHLDSHIECSDNDVAFGASNAGSSMFLSL